MEVETIHLDHDSNSTEDSAIMQLVPPTSPETSGVCGNPSESPRVGDQYQAEIPPMVSEMEHLKLLMHPFDSGGIDEASHSFLIGLPILITWMVDDRACNGENKECGSLSYPRDAVVTNGPRKSKESKRHCTMKKEGMKPNAESDVVLEDGKESKRAIFQSKVAVEVNPDQLCKGENSSPVPGLPHRPWTNADIDGFILGLYTFGKNFVQIKRFIDRDMGEILSFYYGKFFGSNAYHRWSDTRKAKRKKCVYGHRIFTGWRQHELFSRLDPHVPSHFRDNFLEVSTEFMKGKVSLEDYVFNLKTIVGIQALVEAIGIGKGKEDLTSLAMESVKGNPLFPDCPNGKDCSSLTANDIIKLLTGGFRLSKARCNDIFWEAVWPRLLARGWHSEQPKNQGYIDTHHYLVFLIPGIKKFSRRKLVKGNHYFDSVSDVLNKVASEPKLIELEAEETRGSFCNGKDGLDPGGSSNLDDPSNSASRHYLKPPQVSKCNLNRVKFTVVDSSLANGKKLSEVKEMRYSADDLKAASLFTALSSKTQRIFLEGSLDKNDLDSARKVNGVKNMDNAECNNGGKVDACGSNNTKFTIVDTSLLHEGKSVKARELRCLPVEYEFTCEMSDSTENEVDSSDESLVHRTAVAANESNHMKGVLDKSFLDQRNELKQLQASRTIKHQFSRRVKSSHSNNLVPLVKRRRLTACSDTQRSHAIENFARGLGSKKMEICCALKAPSAGSNDFRVSGCQKKSSSTKSSAECNPEGDSSGSMLSASCFDMGESHRENEEPQSPLLIDLNLPQVATNSDDKDTVLMEVDYIQRVDVNDTSFPSKSEDNNAESLSTSVDGTLPAEEPDMNPRRHSTRNRPMTIKALAALESGFLEVKKRPPKNTGIRSRKKSLFSIHPEVLQQSQSNMNSCSMHTGIVDSKEERDASEALDDVQDSWQN